MKPAALFAAGFFMEFIWTLGTLAVTRRHIRDATLAAAVAPFVTGFASAWTVVDEPSLDMRLQNLSWYAVGAVWGLGVVQRWIYPRPPIE